MPKRPYVSLGIGHIILESDAQKVVRAINTDAYIHSAMGFLIQEVKLLGLNFLSFECVFRERNCNKAAHDLAVLGLLCTEGEEQITSFAPDSVCNGD